MFCYSDEEADDPKVLLFLPVSPDMDELEEGYSGDQVGMTILTIIAQFSQLVGHKNNRINVASLFCFALTFACGILIFYIILHYIQHFYSGHGNCIMIK